MSVPVGWDVSSLVVEEGRMSCNHPADRAVCRPVGGKGTVDSAGCVVDIAGSAGCVVDIGHIQQRPEAATDMDMWTLAVREGKM